MRRHFCGQVLLYSFAISVLAALATSYPVLAHLNNFSDFPAALTKLLITLAAVLGSVGWLAGCVIQARFHRHERPIYFNLNISLLQVRALSLATNFAVAGGLWLIGRLSG